MKVLTQITGDKQVDNMLKRMSDRKIKTTLKQALRKIARPVVNAVRSEIDVAGINKSGNFKRSIKVLKSKDKNPAVIVGAKHNIFPFPTLLEFGSEKNDVNFEGRKTFDTVYNATKVKAMRDIETEVINIIRKKIK